MKIMFIIPRMVGGGAERVISVLANEFVNWMIGLRLSRLVKDRGEACGNVLYGLSV